MKILFFTGKGGVGKSTMSAAAAWQLSQKGRVLIISLDPAHNLGDVFNLTLNDSKKRFSRTLDLKEINLQKLAKEYLQREINVLTDTYKYLQTLNLDNYFSVLKYSPGIEEYALLTSIEETIHNETGYDYIVFDTPPTGLTLRFLALPRVTITWIDRLIQIRQKILEKRYTIQKIRGGTEEEKKAREITLEYDERDDDVLNRLQKLRANYESLTTILEGRDCAIALVFNPDILSLRESERLIEGLKDLHLPLRLLINNKVTTDTMSMANDVERRLQAFSNSTPIMRVTLSPHVRNGTDGAHLYNIDEDIASELLKQLQ